MIDRAEWLKPRRLIEALRRKLGERSAERELRTLDAQASAASVSYRPQYYLRATQLAASLNRREDALAYYGLAIDCYLEAGRGKAAETLCRKVIEEYPDVVRARRTLALLAWGRGEMGEAAELLHDYALAAKRSGDPYLLGQSLKMIAVMSEDPVLHDRVLEELGAIGEKAGKSVRAQEELAEEGVFDPRGGRWAQAMEAALLDPRRLRELRV